MKKSRSNNDGLFRISVNHAAIKTGKKKCIKCLQIKDYKYSHTTARSNVYKDEYGKNWYGNTCAVCHAVTSRQATNRKKFL